MLNESSRRSFLRASGTITASALFAGVATGCASTPAAQMSTSEQVALTGTEAVRAIRSGRLSAEAYAATLLARAKALSGLNSLIALNEAGAMSSARRIDQMRASGATLPPLAGLPIVVKDNINTSDMPTTGGTPALRDVRPDANAPALQRLIDAGAIVLGKANMHELAFGTTSTNFSPFAGTVRIPASFCGLAGFRPTVGNGGPDRRYDGAGVLPISHTRDTIGPMARIVAAPKIDAVNGSSKISIDGGPPVGTFGTTIRNTDPGSTTGIPGITLPVGLTSGGMPVGLAVDGPVGSDGKLLGIGMSMETVFGMLKGPDLSSARTS